MHRRILARDAQSGPGSVGRDDSPTGKQFRERHRDTAAAGSDVRDGAGARSLPEPRDSDDAAVDVRHVEYSSILFERKSRLLDERLRRRPRDQRVVRDEKVSTEKFADAENVRN